MSIEVRSEQGLLGPLLIGISALELSVEECEWMRHPLVGGVVLFTRNFENVAQLENLTAAITTTAGRDLLICVDHEGGRVERFKDGFTRLPPLSVLGALYLESMDKAKDFAYRHARVMATELLLCGVDMSFAPVLDIGDRSVVIGDRAFAADSEVIIELSKAYIAGMHDAGMSATGKHFPGHGSVEADSHTDDVCDPRSYTDIENLDLKPFAALGDSLDAMMMAHVLYPEVDELPAGYSSFWIKTILRQKLAYNGTVFSDDLGMYAAKAAGGLSNRVRNSLAAGCDSVLICDPDDVRTYLADNNDDIGKAADELSRLKGRCSETRDDIEQVAEWHQWVKSIKQLEMEQ